MDAVTEAVQRGKRGRGMTREEAYTLLEVMAINITGELATIENPVLAKQLEAIDMAIEALSAEVVRCQDCKYLNRKEAYGDEWKECTHYPQHHIRLNDYCSYGERKEP